ncbi:MAG: DNA-binding response regulator [Bacteroidetes bacterium]|nr:MAG: DNA-binding response regulator [Bacteroidota bacterium]
MVAASALISLPVLVSPACALGPNSLMLNSTSRAMPMAQPLPFRCQSSTPKTLIPTSKLTIVLQAANGKLLIEGLANMQTLPNLVLLDISMPIMDGFATAAHLQKHFPSVKVLALSMMDNESAIITMIKNGARGYVLKDADPAQLRQAIADVLEKGYHYSDLVTGRLIYAINREGANENLPAAHANKLTEREREFLDYCCTEYTYKEIASLMGVSPRTVDGYRDGLFEKLDVKSRVGLAMYAVRHGLGT